MYIPYIYIRFTLLIYTYLFDLFVTSTTVYSAHVKNDAYQEQSISWDGLEIRLLRLIAQVLNFTLEIRDASLSKVR